ncbi:MAG: HEAT repeat domain-containing protein, partial [Pyrinomonadaceae bacterium]
IPDSKDTADQVAQIYQGAAGNDRLPSGWRDKVEYWLKFNSTLFLSELVAEAEHARDEVGGIKNEYSLVSLAKVDSSSAKPILRSLLNPDQRGNDQIRTEALALALLFKIAVEDHDEESQEKYRLRLLRIAEDVSVPAKARDAAINGLLRTEWSGRDEWYRAQFADKTLTKLTEGATVFCPLAGPLERDPDRWLPFLTRLFEGGDRDERQNAGASLVQFAIANPRRDAILPLLSWLGDRRMLNVDAADRASFIKTLGQVDIPECVPYLSFVVQVEEENCRNAANILARYRDQRAVRYLGMALRYQENEENRRALIGALIDCGGYSESTQITAVVEYAGKLTTKEGREEVNRPRNPGWGYRSFELELGKFLANRTKVAEDVASAILARAEQSRRTDPFLSSALFEVAHRWQVATVDLDLLRQIREGTASADVIANAIKRRGQMRERSGLALQTLVGAKGFASGVAAVLSADEAQIGPILAGSAPLPKIAMLVCARLAQQPLPVRAVAALLKSQDPLLALAAERYLLAEDSPEARAQLWERYPRQAYFTGWRELIERFDANDFANAAKIEAALQNEVFSADDAPREIYAILDRNQRPHHILRVYRDRAVYTWNESDARYRECVVSANDLAEFRLFVANRKLTLQGPQFSPCEICRSFEFLAMNRSGARRTVIQSNILDGASIFGQFVALRKGTKTHYRFEDTFSGVEVLIDDPREQVRDVWQNGNDLRVRIEHEKTAAEHEQDEQDKAATTQIRGGENSVAQRALRYKLGRRERERFAWYGLRNGKLTGTAARPSPIMSADETDLDLDPNDFDPMINQRIGLATAGPVTVLAVNGTPWGLWAKYGTSRPTLIDRAGAYRNPVISSDGTWVVATRLVATPYEETNFLTRINLTTGQSFPVDMPMSDQFDAIVYLPTRGRFLVWNGPRRNPMFTEPLTASVYLLDPVNGMVQRVAGNFSPLLPLNNRMLQPTSKPDEYWAAVPDRKKLQTQVGRYDLNDFSFHPIMTIPYVAFDSSAMWVDEAGGKLLIVIDGQLVRMPLGPPAPVKPK